jgi:hypothetical protein
MDQFLDLGKQFLAFHFEFFSSKIFWHGSLLAFYTLFDRLRLLKAQDESKVSRLLSDF